MTVSKSTTANEGAKYEAIELIKDELPMSKVHIMIGTFLFCVGAFGVVLEMFFNPGNASLTELYPVYTGSMFCMSAGMAGMTLGFVEGFSEMAIGVLIFNILNIALSVVSLFVSLYYQTVTLFLIILILNATAVVFSSFQSFLLLAFLCPICSKAKREFIEAESEFELTLESEFRKSPPNNVKSNDVIKQPTVTKENEKKSYSANTTSKAFVPFVLDPIPSTNKAYVSTK